MKKFHYLLSITASFVLLYWSSIFVGLFPLEELVPGYKNWFMSFPLPDFYIAVCACLAVYYRNKPKMAGLYGAMTGSGLLFLGLYALSYGHNTGLIYVLTTDEVIEIFIKLYCLSVGIFFIRTSWKLIIE
jgi:hypothetical protein